MFARQLRQFALAATASSGSVTAVFDALQQLCHAVVGVKLFTITDHDPARDTVCRLYSSMPAAYPVSGTKPSERDSDWHRRVIGCHETFVLNSSPEIAAAFPDHALIQSLGCGSVINVPIVVAGRVLGTLNCLDAEGRYTPEVAARSELLKLPGAIAMGMHRLLGAAEL